MSVSQLPWKVEEGCPSMFIVVSEDSKTVCHMFYNSKPMKYIDKPEKEEAKANASFICLAVNNHEKLVSALKKLIRAAEFPQYKIDLRRHIKSSKQALQSAEVK
jgi:hypothetical protein